MHQVWPNFFNRILLCVIIDVICFLLNVIFSTLGSVRTRFRKFCPSSSKSDHLVTLFQNLHFSQFFSYTACDGLLSGGRHSCRSNMRIPKKRMIGNILNRFPQCVAYPIRFSMSSFSELVTFIYIFHIKLFFWVGTWQISFRVGFKAFFYIYLNFVFDYVCHLKVVVADFELKINIWSLLHSAEHTER